MSADSPRRHHHHNHHTTGVGISVGTGGSSGGGGVSSGGVGGGGGGVNLGLRGGGGHTMPAIVPPQAVSDRSILDSAIGFINDVTLVHQPLQDPKDTITWARFETSADVSDPRFGDDWELEGNAAPPLLLILGYGLGVQVWAIPANGEAVEVLSWRHGVVTALRVLPTPTTAASALDETGRADEPVDAFAEKRPLVALVDGGSAAASNLLSGGPHGGHMSGGSGASGGNLSGGGSSHFSAVNFVSLKTGAQVKTMKFKNPVLDIQANRSAVVISFHECLAVIDARTLEDRLTITTCFPSPGINPNPIALGPRWLAYAEHKLLHTKRSGGGCDGEGVPSYTATVLNAAKSFGKGLRELGEQVAAGLTGTSAGSGNSSKSSSFDSATGGVDAKQSGVVTIIDVKHPIKDYSPTTGTPSSSSPSSGDPIVAHFVAHSEALVAMEFDSSGMLLLTADRRGHDFHVFRIQPHPVGSSLAAVHHLYVLHRGDTSAKVQHIAFSLDSRWAAVSTLRGTTHVFPITPYGGAMGVRTHTSLHVVNKLSRFHRSAGLGADGRSSSPISHSESTTFVQSLQPYHNPTLPPFPRPAVVQPLAQLRQPFTLGSPPGSASLSGVVSGGSGHHHHHHHQHSHGGSGGGGGSHGSHGVGSHQRQRLSSLSDDSGKPLSVCATFAKSRSWLLEPPTATREAPHRVQRKAVDSLFVMAGHGALIQYDLDTKLASNVAKEKICDDTPIELEVEAKAQWNLGRRKDGSQEIIPPLALDNWLIKDRHASLLMDSAHQFDEQDERAAESWLAQVEIITHAGPHRRLWMGPQFVFKNYNTPSGSNLNHVDAEAVEIGVTKTTTTTLPSTAAASGASLTPGSGGGAVITAVERSSPLNMPLGGAAVGSGTATVATTGRSSVPVLIESGSIEQSPKLMDRFRHGHLDSDYGHGDMRLKEDLADAMRESPSTAAARRETGVAISETNISSASSAATAAAATNVATSCDNACYYDALAEHDAADYDADEQQQQQQQQQDNNNETLSTLASVLPNICSYDQAPSSSNSSSGTAATSTATTRIEKIVNPLGTVTDVHAGISGELQTDMLDEVVGQLAAEDCVIHENCDEALFRPVVAIFCDELAEQRKHELQLQQLDEETARREREAREELTKPPVVLANKLIVPVIAKEVDEVIVQKEKQLKKKSLKSQAAAEDAAQAQRFAELSHLNKPGKQLQSEQQSLNKTASQLKPQATTSSSSASASTGTTTTTTASEDETFEEEMQTSISSTVSIKSSKKSKAKQKQQQKAAAAAATQQQQQQKGSNKKDKKQPQQQQQLEKEKEPDPDPADSLLENKETIAAVMMSSASAQGLALHVQQDEEEAEEPTQAEKVREPEPQPEFEPEAAPEPEQELKALKLSKLKPLELQAKKQTEKAEVPKEDFPLLKPSKTKLVEPVDLEEVKPLQAEEKQEVKPLKQGTNKTQKLPAEEQLEQQEVKSVKSKSPKQMQVELTEEQLEVVKPQDEEWDEPEQEELKPIKLAKSKPLKLEKEEDELQPLKVKKGKAMKLEDFPDVKPVLVKSKALKLSEQTSESAEKKSEELKDEDWDEPEQEEVKPVKLAKSKLEREEEVKPKKSKAVKLEEFREVKPVPGKSKALKLPEQMPESEQKKPEELKEVKPLKPIKLQEDCDVPKPVKQQSKSKPLNLQEELKSKAKLLVEPEIGKLGKSKPLNLQQQSKLSKADELPSYSVNVLEMPPPAVPPPSSMWKSFESSSNSSTAATTTTAAAAAGNDFPDFDDFLLAALKPLEALDALPPLPALEPLQVLGEDQLAATPESLINFESPLQENVAMPRKITPPPRGFTERNLIMALCGSLHYENEYAQLLDKTTTTTSKAATVVVAVEQEEEEEHNKSTSTSNNSSGSEELLLMEESKSKSKKHKRAKTQLKEQPQNDDDDDDDDDEEEKEKQKQQQMDDEELRPLISISMTQEDNNDNDNAPQNKTLPGGDNNDEDEEDEEDDLLHFARRGRGGGGGGTTTDSDGPLPATTSDDGIYASSCLPTAPHKLKTKKLEHKINLIAAIEAATSSSTSSAEESSVETTNVTGGLTGATELELPASVASISLPVASVASVSPAVAASAAATSTPATVGAAAVAATTVLGVGVSGGQPSATKKKTKRRKR